MRLAARQLHHDARRIRLLREADHVLHQTRADPALCDAPPRRRGRSGTRSCDSTTTTRAGRAGRSPPHSHLPCGEDSGFVARNRSSKTGATCRRSFPQRTRGRRRRAGGFALCRRSLHERCERSLADRLVHRYPPRRASSYAALENLILPRSGSLPPAERFFLATGGTRPPETL